MEHAFVYSRLQPQSQRVPASQRTGVRSRPCIAVSIPCMIAVGVGGQPGTATSTGITLETRPHEAYDSPNIPPVQPQSPSATTSFGTGDASSARYPATPLL